MPLELKIISDHAELVGSDAVREFNDDGGSIGRSLQNDWILPDPDRYISGRHATIDFKGGIYYLLDTSSNGVYVNNEMEPVGKGNTRRLFNGDRIRMGDFQFAVSVDSGESLAMPLEQKPTVVPDNIEQLVDEVSLRTGIKLLDEDEIAEDNVFESALFGGGTKPESSATEPDIHLDDEHDVDDAPDIDFNLDAPPAQKTSTQDLEVTTDDLFGSFLDGLGISRADLHPSVSRPGMMLAAGQILRESVKGLTELLASRANLKKSFRLDQTTVLPRYNNPLKLSDNAADLLKQLLVGEEGDYLGGEDAIREACKDLNHHQNAFIGAMSSAFSEFADRFDPEELQQSFDSNGGSNKLLGFLNSKRYWDAYCDLYPILTEKGNDRLPQTFGEEFVRAYERQVADFRRQEREGSSTMSSRALHPTAVELEPDLLATQKLENPVPPQTTATGQVVEADVRDPDLTDSGALEIDQSFIDELDNSMAMESPKDQLKA